MPRGYPVCCWFIVVVLTNAGCIEKPLRAARTGDVAAEPKAQTKAAAPVLLASAAQTPTPQDQRPLDLPPPPPPAKSQSASEPPRDTAPPPAATPVNPNVETTPADASVNLHRILKQAESECANLDSYICRMTKREVVNGSAKPEEIIRFMFRKQPFSLYFRWIGKECSGREVVYVKGKFENKLHIRQSPGSATMALAPDNFLVKRSSRHPITEAGVCAIVDMYASGVAAFDKGQHPLRYLGVVKRQDFDEGTQLEGIEEDLVPGADPNLPRGGRRQLYFNTANHLPALVITRDERGQEVEYYRFDRFQSRVRLDDDDFDPEKLFGKK
jgi:hypothetical protein